MEFPVTLKPTMASNWSRYLPHSQLVTPLSMNCLVVTANAVANSKILWGISMPNMLNFTVLRILFSFYAKKNLVPEGSKFYTMWYLPLLLNNSKISRKIEISLLTWSFNISFQRTGKSIATNKCMYGVKTNDSTHVQEVVEIRNSHFISIILPISNRHWSTLNYFPYATTRSNVLFRATY